MDWCVSLRPAISPERLWSNSVFSLTNVGSGNCAAALWGPIFYTVLEENMKKLETCLIWIKKVVLGINGCKHISDAPLISKLRWDIGGQLFQKVENDENRFFAITSSKLVTNWFCKKRLLRNDICHNYCFLYVL